MTELKPATRWNFDGEPVVRVCFGSHHRSQDCEFEEYPVRLLIKMATDAEIARAEAAEAKLAAAREALKVYVDQQCEGWCRDAGGTFEDCAGCYARAALDDTRQRIPGDYTQSEIKP